MILLYDTYNMYMTRHPSWFIEHEKKLQKTYKVTPEFFVTYDNYLKENFIDKGYIPGKITLLYENQDPDKIKDDTIEKFYDKFQFKSPNQNISPSKYFKYFKYRKNNVYPIKQQRGLVDPIRPLSTINEHQEQQESNNRTTEQQGGLVDPTRHLSTIIEQQESNNRTIEQQGGLVDTQVNKCLLKKVVH